MVAQVRADAARNAARILRTARAVFAELGPEAPLEEIARRAGVGPRTLYRHFPSRDDLVRAALDQVITEDLDPALRSALVAPDPLRGLVGMVESALALASRELNTLAAAHSAGTITAEVYTPFYESLADLAARAQAAGQLRADLVPADLPRIMAMLTSTLWTMAPGSDGWRRYLALVLAGLAPAAAGPLPPAAGLLDDPHAAEWPR